MRESDSGLCEIVFDFLREQDQPGTGTSALVADAYQNDTQLIDGRNLFAPDISLVNVDEIWGSSEWHIFLDYLISKSTPRRRDFFHE